MKKIIIIAKYLDFINCFLKDLIVELLYHLAINKYIIKLKVDKQSKATRI